MINKELQDTRKQIIDKIERMLPKLNKMVEAEQRLLGF